MADVTEMIRAAHDGDLSALTSILNSGEVDLDAHCLRSSEAEYGLYGSTALTLAAKNGRLLCVRLLIHRGASVDATGKNGWTALIFAARYGHLGCLKAFIAAGANVEAATPGGETTALIFAAERGHLGCLKACIAAGANVDAMTVAS